MCVTCTSGCFLVGSDIIMAIIIILFHSLFQDEDVDKLSVIHVSGTKGKGSTCALCERVLYFHGYKTGLFTSPHLVEARERIRINGRPISQELFSKYFWKVYNNLQMTKTEVCSIPWPHFRVSFDLAFIFIQWQNFILLRLMLSSNENCLLSLDHWKDWFLYCFFFKFLL